MVDDEMAFARQLGPDRTRAVDVIARAMCNQSAREDDPKGCSCGWDGGSCVAFGLYGELALAALLAMPAAAEAEAAGTAAPDRVRDVWPPR